LFRRGDLRKKKDRKEKKKALLPAPLVVLLKGRPFSANLGLRKEKDAVKLLYQIGRGRKKENFSPGRK